MAKKNNDEMTEKIMEFLGGKDNVSFVAHCVTRLRFNVKDIDLVEKEKIDRIDGVSGSQWFGKQYQVIVGGKVDEIYETLCNKFGFEQQKKIDENLDEKKGKFSFNSVIEYIAGSVSPILPVLIGCSFVKIVVLLMDSFNAGVGGGTYQVLTFVGDAGFYFLPVYVGATAARKLGLNMGIGMLLGAILIHPSLLEAVNSGNVLNVYGIPMTMVNYSSSLLPILLSVYIAYWINKYIIRYSPESLAAVLVPFLTIMIMLPIELCAVGPLGTVLGTYLGNAIVWIYETMGFVGVALMAAFAPLIVASGMHMTLVVYAIGLFMQYGYEPLVFVTGIIAAFCQGAACLGVFTKTKNKNIKSTAMASFVSAAVGGITEPALYGITLKYKKPLYAAMIGSAIGGAIAGIAKCKAYGLVSSSIWNVMAFLPGGTANFVWMIAACVVGFAITFVLTTILYKEELTQENYDVQI